MSEENKYGYCVGEVVENIVELYDESGLRVDYGTKLRLVAFAPKVRVCATASPSNDTKAYFFNAVRASQEKDYGSRIRASFCTIRKVKVCSRCGGSGYVKKRDDVIIPGLYKDVVCQDCTEKSF